MDQPADRLAQRQRESSGDGSPPNKEEEVRCLAFFVESPTCWNECQIKISNVYIRSP